MTKVELMNNVTRTFHNVGFQLKKHSPGILLAVGVVGTVASTVMACKATTKVNPVLEEAKTMVDNIHKIAEDPEKEYTKEDANKALAITYTKAGLELAKLYAPAVILGAASITCILASNNIIHKRNVALAAAYASVDNGFKEYRGRVIERFGKELDQELKYNIKAKEVEEVVVNEDGTETTVAKTINVADPNTYSEYARFFDEYCKGWSKNAEYNLMFLRQTQSYANDLLRTKGRVFLNEVYEMLGIPQTKAGQVVGWVYDENNPTGDNFIDFGIYDLYNENKRNFVNGYERSILLDFNVDGNIWDLMR